MRPPRATSPPRSAPRPTPSRRPQSFVEAYKAAGYAEPYEAYGAYAYDAANAIINALKVSLASADSRRGGPRRPPSTRLGKVAFDGVTGKVAFDEFGDTTTKVLTVYEVKDGKWAADEHRGLRDK